MVKMFNLAIGFRKNSLQETLGSKNNPLNFHQSFQLFD